MRGKHELYDLLEMYGSFKEKHKESAYKYISKLLQEAKEVYKRDWERSPTPGRDHEQSWRASKGKNLEKLISMINMESVAT